MTFPIATGISPAMNQELPVGPDQLSQAELPPFSKVGADIFGALVTEGFRGYVGYWMCRVFVNLTGANLGVLNPVNFIVLGIVSAALTETARLTYEVALHALGDRQKFENLADPDNATASDRLRQRAWQVISYVGKVEQNIDVTFSRIFNIRTAKEIRNKDIQERDLYFIEVIRLASFVGLDALKTMIQSDISLRLAAAAGYVVLGGGLGPLWYALAFFNGFIGKFNGVYLQAEAENAAEKRKRYREIELRPSCEIAAAMS